MKKALLVCGSGGHSAQGLILYSQLKDRLDCEFLLEKNDPLTGKKIKDAKVYKAMAVRGKKEPWIVSYGRLLICFFQCIPIFFRAKPDVIISTGPGLAIPISIIGKFFGIKIIFIESWSRVTSKSYAGKALYLFADKFFVQWPDQKEKNYPKATFAGRLG